LPLQSLEFRLNTVMRNFQVVVWHWFFVCLLVAFKPVPSSASTCAYTGVSHVKLKGQPFKSEAPLQDCSFALDTEGKGCCDQNQTSEIASNFKELVEPMLGSCPACVKNLRQLWCGYTCSPNQGSFVNVTGADPLRTTFYVSQGFAARLYESCQDVSFAGGTAVKLLWDSPDKFLGMMVADQGITIVYVPDPKVNADFGAFDAKTRACQCECDCNSCSAKCSNQPCPDDYNPQDSASLFTRLRYPIAFVILVSIASFAAVRWLRNQRPAPSEVSPLLPSTSSGHR